jgi:anti-sigma regulatory factor (Ser/Thr protein kinase)
MCDTTPRVELVLPIGSTSPAVARAFARGSGCTAHALEILDDALLLISELVTNSVNHGGPPIVLAIECDGEGLRLQVRDGSPALPTPRTPADDDESGRGLSLVNLIASTWGVDAVQDKHGLGKQVWFELRPQR